MRLVIVNHAHPDTPHVSGMRTGYFAREMARRGHLVVLLTCVLSDGAAGGDSESALAGRLATHDWREPLIIATPPACRRTLERIRRGQIPTVLRRALTLWQFVAFAGVHADWHLSADGVIRQLARDFKPNLVWGTFGNTSNLAVAQQLARRAGCPWVVDVKDNWATFVPQGLRWLMAWRFRDAAGWTSNSRHHQEIASRWLPRTRAEVIYSGVAEPFFVRPEVAPPSAKSQLLLVGSVYDDARLMEYLSVVRKWMMSLPAEELSSVRFTYAGTDFERVTTALRLAPLPCATRIQRQVPVGDLALLAQESFANSYLTASFTFHHKLLELLACGTPLICYPSERNEAKGLAAQTETMFLSCNTIADLRRALATAWAARNDVQVRRRAPAWRWADFGQELEEFLRLCLPTNRSDP